VGLVPRFEVERSDYLSKLLAEGMEPALELANWSVKLQYPVVELAELVVEWVQLVAELAEVARVSVQLALALVEPAVLLVVLREKKFAPPVTGPG
jgi:hypothetical protein